MAEQKAFIEQLEQIAAQAEAMHKARGSWLDPKEGTFQQQQNAHTIHRETTGELKAIAASARLIAKVALGETVLPDGETFTISFIETAVAESNAAMNQGEGDQEGIKGYPFFGQGSSVFERGQA